MSNKKKRRLFDKIAHDCWSVVVEFLDSPISFFNLMLSVKGLFEHMKTISSNSSINIPFEFIPTLENPVPFVSFLKLSFLEKNEKTIDRRKLSRLLKKMFGEDYDDKDVLSQLISRALKYHINTRKLQILLLQNIHDWSSNQWDFRHIYLNHEVVNKNLRELHLEISDCRLTIKQAFPNLINLFLLKVGDVCTMCDDEEKYYVNDIRYCRRYLYRIPEYFIRKSREEESFEEEANEHGDSFTSCKKLDVPDWKKSFPSLRNLRLSCWELVQDLTPLKDQLEVLHLDHTEHTSLKGFKKLRKLRLSDEKSVAMESISDLPLLESFSLDNKGLIFDYLGYNTFYEVLEDNDIYEYWSQPPDVSIRISLRDSFPNLRKINLSASGMRWDTDGNFEMENLELLEEVVVVDCAFSISISNTPSLRRIRCLVRNRSGNFFSSKSIFLELSRCGIVLEEIESKTHLLSSNSWEELETESLQNNPAIKKLDVNAEMSECMFEERNERVVGISISRCCNLSLINNWDVPSMFKISKIEDCEGLETIKIGCISDGFIINNLPSLKSLDIKSFKWKNEQNSEDLFEHVMMQISEICSLQHLRVPSNPFIGNQTVSRRLHQFLRKVEIHEFNFDEYHRQSKIMEYSFLHDFLKNAVWDVVGGSWVVETSSSLTRKKKNGESRLSIVSSESALEEIKIRAWGSWTVEIVNLPNLNLLEVVDLSSSASSDRSLFISRLPKLRKLVVKEISLQKNLKYMPCLEEIVSYHVGVMDLVGLKSLKTVRIIMEDCMVNDWKFQNCPCLESLDITNEKHWNGVGLKDSFLSSKLSIINLPSLKSFEITYSLVRQLVVRNCVHILKLQIHLQYFDPSYFDEKGFEIRGTEFPRLKEMIITVAKFYSLFSDHKLMTISKLSCVTSLSSVTIGSIRECVFESIEGMEGNHDCEVLVETKKVVARRFNSVKSYVDSFKR